MCRVLEGCRGLLSHWASEAQSSTTHKQNSPRCLLFVTSGIENHSEGKSQRELVLGRIGASLTNSAVDLVATGFQNMVLGFHRQNFAIP